MSDRGRLLEQLVVTPGEPAGIAKRDPGGPDFADLAHDELEQRAKDALARGIEELSEAQELLWASDRYAVLVVLQAMDAAGKDSAIEHVMSGVNPQGVQVVSLQAALGRGARPRLPLAHLEGRCPSAAASASSTARTTRRSSRCGCIPSGSSAQRLPPASATSASGRSATRTSTPSSATSTATGRRSSSSSSTSPRTEQKQRFLARLDTPGKEWKFNAADVDERAHWDDYMDAFEEALTATSTPWAPWYVIPADHKRLTQALVALGARRARSTRSTCAGPRSPSAEHAANLEARRRLEAEGGG